MNVPLSSHNDQYVRMDYPRARQKRSSHPQTPTVTNVGQPNVFQS